MATGTALTGAHPRRARPWRRMLRRLRREEDGASSVEFAILVVPFLVMLMGAMDAGLTYFGGRMLDAGTDAFARQIKTGQILAGNFTNPNGSLNKAALQQAVCSGSTMAIFDCSTMVVDVREVADWNTDTAPRDASGNIDGNHAGFTPGGRMTLNIIFVSTKWPRVFNLDLQNVGSSEKGEFRLVSTAAVMVEP